MNIEAIHDVKKYSKSIRKVFEKYSKSIRKVFEKYSQSIRKVFEKYIGIYTIGINTIDTRNNSDTKELRLGRSTKRTKKKKTLISVLRISFVRMLRIRSASLKRRAGNSNQDLCNTATFSLGPYIRQTIPSFFADHS